jgi:hypothetical protein
MTSIVETVGSYLSSHARVAPLLSAANFGVCLWPDVVRQGAPLPNGRLQKVTATRTFGLTEQLADMEATLAIDIWGRTQAEADLVAETICAVLCDPPFFGLMAEGTPQELKVHCISTTSEIESSELLEDGSGESDYRNHKVYKISFDRPALD